MHTILVVEDNQLLRTMLCDKLRENNYSVIEAEDGMEGLNMVENENVSAVISDLVMPNLDGINFLSLLKPIHPEIKMIFMTSISEDHEMYREAAKIVGKDRIFKKSTDLKELVDRVNKICK